MKAENTTVNSNRVINYFNEGVTVTNANQPFYTKVVVPGPMVSGDHKLPNPWNYSVDEEKLASGVVWVKPLSGPRFNIRQTGPLSNSNTDASRVFPQQSLASMAYNTAVDRLNEKVRGSLDLTVAAAELGSTKRMLAVTSGLTSTIEGLAQRKLGLVKRVTREVSGRYLEWRYGWQPLLSDIYDAADESLRYIANKVQRVRATATLKYPESVSKTFTLEGADWKVPVQCVGKHSTAIELHFRTRPDNVDRWTSLNPVSIAWELLPYSFVADWFFDVGSFLRGMETGFLYKDDFVKGYVSHLDYQNHTALINETKLVGANNITLDKVFYQRKSIAFTRSMLDSYPLPRVPSWNTKLGSERLLSAAALLSQFLNYSTQKDPKLTPRQSSKGGFGKSFWERRASDLLLKNGLVR